MNSTFCKLYLIFFLTTVFSTQSFAQDWKRELYFKNISSDEGLKMPTINSITQDSRGYIWIGTIDGLNRYDGYDFKLYLPNPIDSNSIPNSRVNVLYEDDKNNLWIGTAEGLCQFNYLNETFKTYKSKDGFDRVIDISFDKKNSRIWIASPFGGLKYLDLASGIIKNFANISLNRGVLTSLVNADDEDLYIGTRNNGVYKLNLNSFVVEELCNTKTGRFQISSNWIKALHYYGNEVFIGTAGGGLVVYHRDDDKQVFYTPKNSSIPSSHITVLTHDGNNNLYIGTQHDGLIIFNHKDKQFSLHQKENGNTTSLSTNAIRTLFVDKNEDLWVGTHQKGIDFLKLESRDMTLVKMKYSSNNSLHGNNVKCFAQDKNGGMWIGTQEEGLNFYKDGHYTNYKADGAVGSLPSNDITDICIDHNGVVWVSVLNGGFYAFENGKFIRVAKEPYKDNINSFQSIYTRKLDVDKKGILWIATSKGLDSYDTEKNQARSHFIFKGNKDLSKRKNIRTLLLGSDGNVYIGTSTGFYIYHPNTEQSEYFQKDPADSNSLGHDVILDIFEDSNGRIWLGSLAGGLILFEKETKTFKTYSVRNGFPDNFIASIEEDKKGNLWIGSNVGLIKFSPESGNHLILEKSNGLQDSQFNPLASTSCEDGSLIFGGINGFNVFYPDELKIKEHDMDVIITDLRLYDQSVPIIGEPGILTQNIGLVNDFTMLYHQAKYFSLSFSALHFSNPNQVQYKYMLEGLDDDWIYIGNDHHVPFTNLKHGNYNFKLMASTNGLWDNNIKEIGIKIIPPFYIETWFKIAVVVLLITLIISFYFYKIHAHKVRQLILERLVDEKNKEITCQNEELLSTNEELLAQNEEVIQQKEFISNQNIELTEIQTELKEVNLTLEKRVELRTIELNESNEKLNKTVKELDRFVYSASHDLSAPLKSILGLVNIAKLENKNSNLEIHLKYIEDSINKQERVIKSLIQYSRNSRQEIIVRPINVYNLVNQILFELKYMPGSAQVKMIVDIAEETIIHSDELRMKMVLNNLLSNGIKYSDRDKNDSFVHITMRLKENSWLLIVKDNGLGIADTHKEKVFDMFYRASEESDGSGLGLFIVQEAVERLGGNISLESTQKEGSVFELEFPYL